MDKRIWTPGGDVVVGSSDSGPPPAREQAAPPGPGGPEHKLSREDVERIVAQLREIPVAQFVIEQALGFVQIAQVHMRPGELTDASLAIDALRGLLERTEDRLGPSGPELRRVLQQLQLAYVEVSKAEATPPDAPAAG
jgi:hypothetical protein